MFDTQSQHSFVPHFPPEVLERSSSRMMAWADRQCQRAALARLDDRLLRDVGATRPEATAECRRRD